MVDPQLHGFKVHVCYLCFSHHVACFFFFNDTATTEIYTLSLHDALPILKAVLAPADAFDASGTLDEGDVIARVDGELAQVHRSEEHTSELQSLTNLVCRLLLEKKKTN